MEAETNGCSIYSSLYKLRTNQQYRSFHESSAELWASSLKIPILEINASCGEQPVNARSGFIDATGERIIIVSDTGEHMFVAPVK